MNKNLIGLIIGAVIVGLSAGSTIQSVSAQPPNFPPANVLCEKFPKLCNQVPMWCDRHPNACSTVERPDKRPPPFLPRPGCPHCEIVTLELPPNELLVVGKLNNNTYALSVSPQDVLNMLSNVTSMTNASATAK